MKTLYFHLNNKEKEFYFDVKDNMKFRDVCAKIIRKS